MRMHKMTLDEAWKNSISMWRWVASQKRKHPYSDVSRLKRVWLKKHGFDLIVCNCFFCEYDDKKGGAKLLCAFCPGILVEEDFGCCCEGYDWERTPIAFYNKIRSLNRKRLKGK